MCSTQEGIKDMSQEHVLEPKERALPCFQHMTWVLVASPCNKQGLTPGHGKTATTMPLKKGLQKGSWTECSKCFNMGSWTECSTCSTPTRGLGPNREIRADRLRRLRLKKGQKPDENPRLATGEPTKIRDWRPVSRRKSEIGGL